MTTQTIRDNAGWIYDRINDAGLNPEKPLESLDILVKTYIGRVARPEQSYDGRQTSFREKCSKRSRRIRKVDSGIDIDF